MAGNRDTVSANPLHRVHIASARVALVAAAIVATVYLVVAGAVAITVERNLTAQVDDRLGAALRRIATEHLRFEGGGFAEPLIGPRFGAPLLVWTIYPDGTIATNANADLPAADRTVRGPQTISIGGTDVRVEGAAIDGTYVVVGQSMASVGSARSTIMVVEVVVGLVLVVAVFFGSLTIGRRVAAPIDLARQRQMEFTADASHELRTPLSVIEAQTSLALSQERDPQWYRRAFERIAVESRRMRTLVEDLLWLARFDATQRRPDAERVDLAVLAAQAADRFTGVAEARHLTLESHVVGDAHTVVAPPEWLDRLLGVLLDNACKYSPEGGRVVVTVATDGGRVRLTVEDAGPGIPAEERSRIFDRFHRASEVPGGAGLGLAIADAVVRATNGRWEVGSSPSLGGASMAVTWPRAGHGPRETVSTPHPSPAVPPAS